VTPLFWLFCLTLLLLAFLVLWILGKPIPRYRGTPPKAEPSPREWSLGLLGLLLGVTAGLAIGTYVYFWKPTGDDAGFSLPTQENAFLSALCLGAGVGLTLVVLCVWTLSSPASFQHFRAWDARVWRGLDTVKATPFAVLLFLCLGYLYLPGWITGDRSGLRYETPLPWSTHSHGWSDLRQLRATEQRRLMFGWWGNRPGAVWRFQDGSHYRVFASGAVNDQQLNLATRWSSLRSAVKVERRQRDD
jgi:hypothetical protein